MAAGCPLDYPDAIANRSERERKLFSATQLAGHAESRAYIFGPTQVGYVIGLRLATERPSGTVITNWSYDPPWEGHFASLEHDLTTVVPVADRAAYEQASDFRLIGILNERHLLRRGRPAQGFLCGYSNQPVPDSCDRSVSARLTLLDDIGNRVVLGIEMAAVRIPWGRPNDPRHPARAKRRLEVQKNDDWKC